MNTARRNQNYLRPISNYIKEYHEDDNWRDSREKLPSLYSPNRPKKCVSIDLRVQQNIYDDEIYNDKLYKTYEDIQRKLPHKKKEDIEDKSVEDKISELISESGNKRISVSDSLISMWSCRRCTLDNPLQEAVCGACGGSRLSSIGDIDVPKLFTCQEVADMIDKVEKHDEDYQDNFSVNKRLSKSFENHKQENTKDKTQIPNPILNKNIGWIFLFICFLLCSVFL